MLRVLAHGVEEATAAGEGEENDMADSPDTDNGPEKAPNKAKIVSPEDVDRKDVVSDNALYDSSEETHFAPGHIAAIAGKGVPQGWTSADGREAAPISIAGSGRF